MHKFILALLFITPFAYAERWLESTNDAGGKIILLQTNCDNSGNGKLILASAPAGQTIRGCWYYFAEMVQVVYTDGTIYTYDPKNFIVKESK